MAQCPYSACSTTVEPPQPACPSCSQMLLWCNCGTANRLLARFCRNCRTRLRPPAEWRLPKGDARGNAHFPVSVPFSPTLEVVEAGRFHLSGRLGAQFVSGHGHLFFPVAGQGVEIYRERDCRLSVIVPPQLNRSVQALGVTDEFLLIAGSGGVEAVHLLPLLSRGQIRTNVLAGEAAAPGMGGQVLVVTDGPQRAFAVTLSEVVGFGLEELRPLWRQRREGRGGAVILQAGKHLVVAEETGHLSGLDPATGEVRWKQKLVEPIHLRAGAAAWENRVYLLTRSGSLVMLLADLGRAVPTPFRFDEAHGLACAGPNIYVAGGTGVHRCSAMDSYPTTLTEMVAYAPPLVTNGTLFTGVGDGGLAFMDTMAAFDRARVRRGVSDLPLVSPVCAGDRIFLASDQGEVVSYTIHPGGNVA